MAPAGARLGVAVSGGADSVCLLEVLRELGYELHVLHVNHGLRGADSDEDERFVRELAAQRGLPVAVHRAEPPAPGENLEQALRRIRYAFFEQARRELRLERVATGHTLSDQAETVILRLARGAGVQGLCGIHPVTSRGIIRPLLETSRAEVRQWLRGRALAWREDASNADPRWLRNRVRAEILPLLAATLNPQIEEALARTASLAWEDEQDWERRVAEVVETLGAESAPYVVEAERIRRLGPALGRRVARRLLEMAAGGSRRPTFDHADAVWRLACSTAGAGRVKAAGATAWRSLDWIRFDAVPVGGAPAGAVRLEGPGEARLGPWRIVVAANPDFPDRGLYNEVSELVSDRAQFPFEIRFWKPGDRFHPAGRSGPVKLKELFQRSGVPSWERAEWPIVEAGGRVIWCRGFGAAAWARPAGTEEAGLWIAAAREEVAEQETVGRQSG